MDEVRFKGENLSERARRNLAILEAIRRSGPISKTEISKLVDLNIVTVSNYVDNFIHKKLILERELDVSTGGRRPLLVELNSRARYVIGVGLNLLNMVGVMVDLEGANLVKVTRARPNASVKELVSCLVDITKELLEKSRVEKERISGIGVGIAGIVNKRGGTIRWPENWGESYVSVYVPVRELLEKEFGIPTFVENDATVAAFGEQWLSLEPNVRNLIYMFSGVGCGIMINGEIYRGASGCAGEISIHNSKEDDKFNCEVGDPCFLKRGDVDLGLVSHAKRAVGRRRNSEILKLAGGQTENIQLRDIFEAARRGDPLALELIEIAGRKLGIKVAWLVNLLNPEVVIIGGGVEEAGGPLLDQVKRAVDEWAFEEMASAVRIIPSRLGEDGVALGAASLAIRRVFVEV